MSDNSSATVEDMSGWFMCGRIHSDDARPEFEAAVAAEELGFNRLFLSERHNLKEAGAILGGLGAMTSRIGFGTGVIAPASRHPVMTAALGATLQAAYGPRFTLGVGRSEASFFPGAAQSSYQALLDYVGIVKRLWAGEVVTYDGPAGSYENISLLGDVYDGRQPEVWMGTLGRPKGAAAAAAAFDGVLLWPYLTLEAAATIVGNIRRACEEIGRDPGSVRICLPVVTCPDMDEMQVRLIAFARLVTYITWPPNNKSYLAVNNWDRKAFEKVMEHPLIAALKSGQVADLAYHREDLLDLTDQLPRQWVTETCAIGPVDHCVRFLQQLRDIGVDEIATYGTTPQQNAGLINAWRVRPEAPAAVLS